MSLIVLIFVFKVGAWVYKRARHRKKPRSEPLRVEWQNDSAERVKAAKRLEKRLETVARKMEKYKDIHGEEPGWTDTVTWRGLEWDKEKLIDEIEGVNYDFQK